MLKGNSKEKSVTQESIAEVNDNIKVERQNQSSTLAYTDLNKSQQEENLIDQISKTNENLNLVENSFDHLKQRSYSENNLNKDNNESFILNENNNQTDYEKELLSIPDPVVDLLLSKTTDDNNDQQINNIIDNKPYKLYRVVLEQTNLETWNNTTTNYDNNTIDSIMDDNDELNEAKLLDQNYSFSITSQGGGSLLSNTSVNNTTNLRDNNNNNNNKILNISSQDNWSNIDNNDLNQIEEMTNISNEIKENIATDNNTEDFKLEKVEFVSSKLNDDNNNDNEEDDEELVKLENDKQNNIHLLEIIKTTNKSCSTSPSLSTTSSSPGSKKSTSALPKSPVIELENQLKFYDRVGEKFFNDLGLDKNINKNNEDENTNILLNNQQQIDQPHLSLPNSRPHSTNSEQQKCYESRRNSSSSTSSHSNEIANHMIDHLIATTNKIESDSGASELGSCINDNQTNLNNSNLSLDQQLNKNSENRISYMQPSSESLTSFSSLNTDQNNLNNINKQDELFELVYKRDGEGEEEEEEVKNRNSDSKSSVMIIIPKIIIDEHQNQLPNLQQVKLISQSETNEDDLTKITNMIDSFNSEIVNGGGCGGLSSGNEMIDEQEDESLLQDQINNISPYSRLIRKNFFSNESSTSSFSTNSNSNLTTSSSNNIFNNTNTNEQLLTTATTVILNTSESTTNNNNSNNNENNEKKENEKLNQIDLVSLREEDSSTVSNYNFSNIDDCTYKIDQDLDLDLSNHDDTIINANNNNKSILNEENNNNKIINSHENIEEENNINSIKNEANKLENNNNILIENEILSINNNNIQTNQMSEATNSFASSKLSMSPLKITTKNLSPLKQRMFKYGDTDNKLFSNEDILSEDDEFFLAISSTKLETGSCPEFYWYPIIPYNVITNSGYDFESRLRRNSSNTKFLDIYEKKSIKRRRVKSFNDLTTMNCVPFKSYDNITHNNYVQMVNSMINGAISDAADPEYVEYVKRHIQGLFENFTPVLMKSKSNEEIAMNSPSRNKIVEIAQSAIPKSISFDFKLIEENKLEQMKDDPMDFAKFGFGIEDNKSINDKKDDDISSESLSTCDTSSSTKSIENENQQTIIEQSLKADDSFVKEIREMIVDIIETQINKLNSISINYDNNKESFIDKNELSLNINKENEDDYMLATTPIGSESSVSTVVNALDKNKDGDEMERLELLEDLESTSLQMLKNSSNLSNDTSKNNNNQQVSSCSSSPTPSSDSTLPKFHSSVLNPTSDETNLDEIVEIDEYQNQSGIVIKPASSFSISISPIFNTSELVTASLIQTKADEEVEINNESVVIDEFELHYKENLGAQDEEDQLIENNHQKQENENNNDSLNDSLEEDINTGNLRHRSSSLLDSINQNEQIIILNDNNISTESASTVSKSPPSEKASNQESHEDEQVSVLKIINEPSDENVIIDIIEVVVNKVEEKNNSDESEEKISKHDSIERDDENVIVENIIEFNDNDNDSETEKEIETNITENKEKEEAITKVENIKNKEEEDEEKSHDLTRSNSSSTTTTTSTNDWLDVQKAINEYQKLNFDDDFTSTDDNIVSNDNKTDLVNKLISNSESGKESKSNIEPQSEVLSLEFDSIIFELQTVSINGDDNNNKENKTNFSKTGGTASGGSGNQDPNDSSDNSDNNDNDKNMKKDSNNNEKNNNENNKLNIDIGEDKSKNDSLNDIIIDCKVNYFVKNENDEDINSSIEDSHNSSDLSEKKDKSDYDNIDAINTDINKQNKSSISLADIDSNDLNNLNQNNETLPSLKSTDFKALDDLDDEDEEEQVEYNFVEDFTDLSKELDDHWIQEDELWLNDTNNNNSKAIPHKLLITTSMSNFNIISSIHQPRVLERIDEEASSIYSERAESVASSSTTKIHEDDVDDDEETVEITKTTNDIPIDQKLLENIEQFKIVLEYKYKNSNESNIKEKNGEEKENEDDISASSQQENKLRTKDCNIDSLLGSSDGPSTEDQNRLSPILHEEKLQAVIVETLETVENNEELKVGSDGVDILVSYDRMEKEDESETQNTENINEDIGEKCKIINKLEEQNEITEKDASADLEQQLLNKVVEQVKFVENVYKNNFNKAANEAATENDASDLSNSIDDSIKKDNKIENQPVDVEEIVEKDVQSQEEFDDKLMVEVEHIEFVNEQIEVDNFSTNNHNNNTSTTEKIQEKNEIINKSFIDSTETDKAQNNLEQPVVLSVKASYNIENEIEEEEYDEEDEDYLNKKEVIQEAINELIISPNSAMKAAESEIDLTKLKLNIVDELEESASSDKLKEVLSDIEKEIEENKSNRDERLSQSSESIIEEQGIFGEEKSSLALQEPSNENNLVQPNLSATEVTRIDSFNMDEEEELIKINKKLSESTSWPLITNNQYNLTNNKNDNIDVKPSITSDRLTEAEKIYIRGFPAKIDSKSIGTSYDEEDLPFSTFDSKLSIKTDSIIQVDPFDFPSRKMIDTQTQMTPPLSPVKPNPPTVVNKFITTAIINKVEKVSVATETDEIDLDKLISNEEKSLMKKLIEKENSLRSQSIATQTLNDEEKKVTEDDNDNKPVKFKYEDLEIDQDDEQCLKLLQDMKKMDDQIKKELTDLDKEYRETNETHVIACKDNDEKIYDSNNIYDNRVETDKSTTTSTDSKERNIQSNQDRENDTTMTTSSSMTNRQNIKIQNISIEEYMKKRNEETNTSVRLPIKLEIKTNQETEASKDVNKQDETKIKEQKIEINVKSPPSMNNEIPTSAILADRLRQKNKENNDSLTNNEYYSMTKMSSSKYVSNAATPTTNNTTNTKSNIKENLNIINNTANTKSSQNNSFTNNSNFIDLLSLNLDRSKTWVEMTEAKLNYMIGETDAALRSMCFDSSDDDEITTSLQNNKIVKAKEKSSNNSLMKRPQSVYENYSRQLLEDRSNTSRSSALATANNRPISSVNKYESEDLLSGLDDMTKAYLDNYKKQLEESRRELNSKMSLLEKEKEKISKIKDIRKREIYMRRKMAIEAFKLERDRELNQPSIDYMSSSQTMKTNKPAITSINLNNSNETDYDYDYIPVSSRSHVVVDHSYLLSSSKKISPATKETTLPSQTREKLAKLRRDVLNSTCDLNESSTQNMNNYNDTSLNSSINTPKLNYYYSSSNNILDTTRVSSSIPKSTSTSYLPSKTTLSSTKYLTTTSTSTNNNKVASPNGPFKNSNITPITSSYSIPVRINKSYSSTPRNNSNSPNKNTPYDSNNNDNTNNNNLYNENIIKSSDSRLLMPAINLDNLNYSKTSNLSNSPTGINNSGGSPRSIIDESRLLLREYEQLRSDSVSEIQRAHDSLNAR